MQEKLSEVVLILIGSTLTTLILATLIILSVFIGQRRKFRHRKELIEMKSNYDKEVLRTQLETQMQTLETISRELHDNVGTLISMAMVHLKSTENTRQTTEANQMLDEAMEILRDISRSINPDNIQKRGLSQSIRNELDRIRKSGQYKTNFTSEGVEFAIDPQNQVILFRIIQEALNNILKHARANEIQISLIFKEPKLSITIADNGQGFLFQPEQGDSISHSGLANMTKRARLIGGSLEIKSKLNAGTIIEIQYPAFIKDLSKEKYHKYGMHKEPVNTELTSS
jgi:signal transduction histidine kinase